MEIDRRHTSHDVDLLLIAKDQQNVSCSDVYTGSAMQTLLTTAAPIAPFPDQGCDPWPAQRPKSRVASM